MEYTRRKFLATSTATVTAATFMPPSRAQRPESPSCYTSQQYTLPTPSEPEEPSSEAIISEAYGELVLSPDRPYWIWPVCSTSDPVTIEYEVRTEDYSRVPSIVVVNETGLEEYRLIADPHPWKEGPITSSTTVDLPWLGQRNITTGINLGNINFENISKHGRSNQSWREGEKIVDYHTVACLNSAEFASVHKRHTIKPGTYYVVFDWTNDVLQKPDEDTVSAQVSLRATRTIDEQVEETATASMEQLYGKMNEQPTPFVETTVNVAEAICKQVPDAFQEISVSDIHQVAPQAGRLVSSVNILLTILEDQLGYDTTIMPKVTAQTATWTRWGLSALPIASSMDQLLDDACAVADAKPAEVTDGVERMLMSLGIFVADLVAAHYGVAGRAAKFVTGLAHKYFLGFVARVLGLKTYLVLLRELYTITRTGITEVLSAIKAMTRDIADAYDFLTRDDVKQVESLNESSLQSLDFDVDLFSLSPECSP